MGERWDEGQIAQSLRLFTQWRRDDEDLPQPSPLLVGKSIDEARDALVSLRRELEAVLLKLGDAQEAVVNAPMLTSTPATAEEVCEGLGVAEMSER